MPYNISRSEEDVKNWSYQHISSYDHYAD